jgi:hypothetical protein
MSFQTLEYMGHIVAVSIAPLCTQYEDNLLITSVQLYGTNQVFIFIYLLIIKVGNSCTTRLYNHEIDRLIT